MTKHEALVPRGATPASRALCRAIRPGPDDADHPGYEILEALVDGRLSEVDRDVAESHLSICELCSEDRADLLAVRSAIGR